MTFSASNILRQNLFTRFQTKTFTATKVNSFLASEHLWGKIKRNQS